MKTFPGFEEEPAGAEIGNGGPGSVDGEALEKKVQLSWVNCPWKLSTTSTPTDTAM